MLFSKQGSQQFGDSFVSAYQINKQLDERRQELEKEYNFKNRQLRLDEAFRRDEMTQRQEYYDYLKETGKSGLVEKGFTMDQQSPDVTLFGQGFDYPPTEVKMPEIKKLGEGIQGSGKYSTWGIPGTNETIKYYLGEDTSNGGGGTNPKLPDISGEVGSANKIIALMDSLKKDDETVQYENPAGETVKVDKNFLRAEGKKFVSDALTKAGVPIQGDLITDIRNHSGITDKDGAKVKRTKLFDAIDYVRGQGNLNEAQYEALRYWAQMWTR